MDNFIRAAGGLLKTMGCEDITFQQLPNQSIAKMMATSKGTPVVVRVLTKPEWGLDLPLKTGQNWNDVRYPFKSVQFITPTPGEGIAPYTHYLLVSGCNTRIVLVHSGAIAAANKGWLKQGDVFVQTAIVENWNPRVTFFTCTTEGWVRDIANMWTKPVEIPMDADAFLASL